MNGRILQAKGDLIIDMVGEKVVLSTQCGKYFNLSDESRQGKGRVKMRRSDMLDISSFPKELHFYCECSEGIIS